MVTAGLAMVMAAQGAAAQGVTPGLAALAADLITPPHQQVARGVQVVAAVAVDIAIAILTAVSFLNTGEAVAAAAGLVSSVAAARVPIMAVAAVAAAPTVVSILTPAVVPKRAAAVAAVAVLSALFGPVIHARSRQQIQVISNELHYP